jgi:hypothetical protein
MDHTVNAALRKLHSLRKPPPELMANTIDDSDSDSDSEHEDEEPTKSAGIDYDGWLMESFILAIKYIIRDKQLPILVSTFWTILQRSAPISYLAFLI